MQRVFLGGLFLLLAATPSLGQVRVELRLEKPRYLAGEPVVLILDVVNVGDEAVGYAVCDGDVRLAVTGVERRVPPNILGCFGGMGIGRGVCSGSDPPLLAPGRTTTFKYLLREYDLKPGHYELTASGKAGVRWNHMEGIHVANVPPPLRSKHSATDPVPGAQFDRTLPLHIVAPAPGELQTAFAPLVADAHGTVVEQRHLARAAIVDSAPPFLESLIARFVAESEFSHDELDALRRIGTPTSRATMKQLFRAAATGDLRATTVLSIARIGHADDAAFLATVLEGATLDQWSRQYAALGLGYIGGDEAVRYLEHALLNAPADVRPSIATALGNTRSPLAVPILIGMFGNNAAHSAVCAGLQTLTHDIWCDGSSDDPAATRRRWLRRWQEIREKASIFGPENCPPDPVFSSAPTPAVEPTPPPRYDGLPTIVAPRRGVAAAGSLFELSGYNLGLRNMQSTRAIFIQRNAERIAAIGRASGHNDTHILDVVVPDDLTAGRWEVAIEANGLRSAPIVVEIIVVQQFQLTAVSPARPHPAQHVHLTAKPFAPAVDHIELTDARGIQYRIETYDADSDGIRFRLPDEVADGEATVRAGRSGNGVERYTTALRFVVTSGPLPLKVTAVSEMRPVAPGQWTDLMTDHESDFEIGRADRIEVEFRQGDVAVIRSATGPRGIHIEVPANLKPGIVTIRNRTWIEQAPSEWSPSSSLSVLKSAVPTSVVVIQAGPPGQLAWSSGNRIPRIEASAGEALVLRGHFPVRDAAQLRVHLRRANRTVELRASNVEGGVRVEIPTNVPAGDWRLIVDAADGRTPPKDVTTVRVK